jgi:hypothetical protein
MDGRELKQVQSVLRNIANEYRGSSDADQRGVGRAIDSTLEALALNLERSNPTKLKELQAINSSYAMFARMRQAAVQRTTSAGVFTPSDLLQAARKGDSSTAKGSFARGDALMQAFGEAAQKVLPSSVPDSGTTGRALGAAMLGGGAYLGHPAIAAGVAAGAGGYTKPGMAVTNRYMDPRTRAHRAIRSPTTRAAGQGAFQAGRTANIEEGKPRLPLRFTVQPDPLRPGGGDPLGARTGP